MWLVNAYKKWVDFQPTNKSLDKPTTSIKKDDGESAVFVASQLIRKFCVVELLDENGFSRACYYNGGADERFDNNS